MSCDVENWPGGQSIVSTGYACRDDGAPLCRIGILVATSDVPRVLHYLERVFSASAPAVALFDYEARGIGLKPVVGP